LGPTVLALLRELSVHRVLDIGSGNGVLCGEMHAAGFDSVGIEVDPEGVVIARDAHPGVSFHCMGVDTRPDALLALESPFEAVVSTEVIEHLYDPRQLPVLAAGVLKAEGGWLILSTPYHGYLKNLALSLANKWDHHHTALWHGGHIKFWSRTTLGQLLEDNGFQVIRFVGVARLPFLWKSMVLLARKRVVS